MKTLLNQKCQAIVEDQLGKTMFYIYANRPLKYSEDIQAIGNKSLRRNVILGRHPEYGIPYEFVHIYLN